MLLRSPGVVEKRPPRLWSLGVAAGLLSLAALVAGVGLRAGAARADEPAQKEEPKKEEPKKEEGKKEAPKKGGCRTDAEGSSLRRVRRPSRPAP